MTWCNRRMFATLALVAFSAVPQVVQCQTAIKWGDVNRDGTVGAVDAQAILSGVVGLPLPSGFTLVNGDANCDAAIGALDAQIVLSFVVSLDVSRFCVGTAIPAKTIAVTAGNNQSATAGAAVVTAPSVKTTDVNGNAVSGVSVTFAVASGGGLITGGTVNTGSDGVAAVGSWTLGATAGTNTLTATSTGLTGSPITFTATGTAGAAAILIANSGANQSAPIGAAVSVKPSAKVTDANGNPVAGTAVTFAVTGGGGSVSGSSPTSSTDGIATIGGWTLGATAGTNTLTATAQGLVGSPLAFLATGTSAATQLGISTQPAGAVTGVNLGTQPVIEVRNASNVLASGSTASINAEIASGSGTLSGTTTVAAVNGVATFANLRISGTGPTALRFTSPGLTTAVSNNFTVTSGGTDPCLTVPTVTVGETKTGSLAAGDCQYSDGTYLDQYRLTLGTATAVRIAMTSSIIDAFLIVTDAAGAVVTFNDDDPLGGTTNSAITTTLPAGTYTIAATSYGVGETGAYSLAVTVPPPDACSATPAALALGQTVNGSLATSDCRLVNGQYADRFQFTLASTTTIRLDLASTAFDAYLYLTSTNGTIIREDDDGGAGLNSHIQVTLNAGTYIAWPTSFGAGATGSYSLSLAQASTACSSASAITVGQTATGQLGTTDCQFSDGTYADAWQFTVASSATVTIEMSSTAFDTYLYLSDASGTVVATNDDGGTGTNSRIVTTLSAGTYTIWANSFGVGQGAYQLSLSVPSTACETTSAIASGQTRSGSLASSDCRLSDGSYADRWQISLSSSTALSITMSSTAFDTYLFMRDANGGLVAADDDGAGGTNSRIQGTFAAGTYVVYANSFLAGVTGTYELAVAGTTATPGAINLRVDRAYLVQSTQTSTGSVPLIQGRDALLRVFVRADQTNNAAPVVRARFYQGTTLIDTRTINAQGTSTPTSLTEGILASTWNVLIPGSVIQPNVKMLVDVDPSGTIAETNESDNMYPASGIAATIDVRTIPTLNLTFVPVLQSVNGRIGNVTASSQASFLAKTRAVWPLGTINSTVRQAYTTTLPALQSSDGNGSWSALLSELNALRVLEAPTRYYYGVLNVSYTSGIAGLGYLGRPTAIGWDYSNGGEVMAHELGHNFNRPHAPCGNPGSPDLNYPYAGGSIGVYGYDVASGQLKATSLPDLMSYCDPAWISDYTYLNALDFLKSSAPSASSALVPSVLLWGRIDGSRVVLEPAIDFLAQPSRKPTPGPYRLDAADATGRSILSFAFTPDEVADGPHTSRQFAFVVAKSEFAGRQLANLRLSGPDGTSSQTAKLSVMADATVATRVPLTAKRLGGMIDVRWDAATHPIAVIRSAITGQILSFARGGVVTLPISDAAVDVLLSDGVKSATYRLPIAR